MVFDFSQSFAEKKKIQNTHPVCLKHDFLIPLVPKVCFGNELQVNSMRPSDRTVLDQP